MGEQRLRGKVAVITGAGSGVGRATALALAAEGAAVGLIGRTRSTIDETSRLVSAADGRSAIAVADVSVEADVAAAMTAVTDQLGGIDYLIYASAVGLYGPVESYPLADWQQTLASNLTGLFLATRAAIPVMRARGGGAIVAIGSGAGRRGYANLAAYSASKFGLIGFMESLAEEVGKDRIRVSTINPGSILTGFGGRSIEEKHSLRAEGRKYLEPDDVAAAIVTLLTQSERAWTQELNLWPW